MYEINIRGFLPMPLFCLLTRSEPLHLVYLANRMSAIFGTYYQLSARGIELPTFISRLWAIRLHDPSTAD
jgi:hypothetical protein